MFDILKIEKIKENGEKWIALQLEDKTEKHIFWIDCGLMDGYGNRDNFKTNDLYIDWSFNQYIFNLDYNEDIKAKQYQEKTENVDNITYFIDENNDYLVNIIKEVK